jgi:tripartite-type tricarboxylate transporter receptor subunit TctC
MKTIGKCGFATAVVATVCFGALAPSATTAQSYPARTVSIVVPFGAGSITDGMARILADKLNPMWKQSVIVENRPGLPGTASVARSAPDGHILMLTSNGHTIAAVINKGIDFHPVKDFAGVTVIASVPLVAIVPTELPAKTLKEFIALAAASPGKLNLSSAGLASTSFLSAEIFRQQAKLNLVHVPYKGVPDATAAVMRGDVQMYFAPIPNARELAASGKVRAVAINSDKRSPQLPDIPTIAEAGVPDYKYESWFGLMAPAGTSRDIRVKVSRDVAAALQMEDVKDRLTKFGSIPAPTTPEQFDEIIKSDTERYGKVLRDAGVAAN